MTVVELIDQRMPTSSTENHALADLARRAGLPAVATGNVHYASPRDHNAVGAAGFPSRSIAFTDTWFSRPPAANPSPVRYAVPRSRATSSPEYLAGWGLREV